VSEYEFIDSQKAEPANLNSVVKMCRWLAVSTPGFYHWPTRPQSATSARRRALTARIQHYFEESEGTYGYRRIHAGLAAEQTGCSPGLVRQIMRHKGLVACQPRPFRITTEADAEAAAGMPDLVQRNFIADRPGVKFVGDITYIHTWQGFVYLATVIDCYSKKVVGRSIADHLRTELVADALKKRRRYDPDRAPRDLALRSGQRLHLDRLQGPGDPPGHASVDGTNRRVPGQQHGRIVLLGSEKRACVSDRLRD
jgi:transposase InsO family protein